MPKEARIRQYAAAADTNRGFPNWKSRSQALFRSFASAKIAPQRHGSTRHLLCFCHTTCHFTHLIVHKLLILGNKQAQPWMTKCYHTRVHVPDHYRPFRLR
jgi:hypothetical protein